MRLMAVMAHPDDAEIWCGGTLIRHAENGDEVRICTLSYTEDSERGQEAQKSAKLIDCEVGCLGLEDTRVRDSDQAVELVKKSIESFRPELIITHWFDDTHPDHEAVFLILRRALVSGFLDKSIDSLNSVPQVFCCDTYSSMGLRGPFQPNERVDVTQVWERKLTAIHAHESQPLEFYLNMIERQCRAHGKAANTKFAEAFIRIPLYSWPDERIRLGS